MDDEVVAMSEADAEAVAAVERHHAILAGSLATLVERLMTAGPSWEPVRDELVAWCRDELVPHAQAEEKTLYPAAAGFDRARLLVDAMIAEHGVVVRLVEDLAGAADPIRAAGTATALQTLFETHLAKENDQVLPLLAQAPGVDLAGLLAGMHELLGHQERN
jgi:iron-sulfur cluster repair protein YtfE (RIC family)